MLRRYQKVRIESHDIPVRGLPRFLDGLRITQLSDFHYDGDGLTQELLLDAISASNELNPDMVVLTGDYVTDSPAPIYRLVP
ncbi:MAG: metallophosphoesterase, partial [Acaryochloridaceae cyanobacterium RL_2_7]|nr:metallophosphoesterase [Acaryochloridaceae cyanobacterium RL_2_7]